MFVINQAISSACLGFEVSVILLKQCENEKHVKFDVVLLFNDMKGLLKLKRGNMIG